jgi:hypothetical protein
LLKFVLPYRQTNRAEAAHVIRRCGLPPSVNGWRVTEDGALALGRAHPDTPTSADFDGVDCIAQWALDNRVEIRMIGWEVDRG